MTLRRRAPQSARARKHAPGRRVGLAGSAAGIRAWAEVPLLCQLVVRLRMSNGASRIGRDDDPHKGAGHVRFDGSDRRGRTSALTRNDSRTSLRPRTALQGDAIPARSTTPRGDHHCHAPSRTRPSWPTPPCSDRGLWRGGLRISEALALAETDIDAHRGSVLIRHGKGDKRREAGMDQFGFEQLAAWLAHRVSLPVGPLFCVIDGPTRGRQWAATAARAELRQLAAEAGVRRRFAPHQLRHAHAVELAREEKRSTSFNASSVTPTSEPPRPTCKASTPQRSSTPSDPDASPQSQPPHASPSNRPAARRQASGQHRSALPLRPEQPPEQKPRDRGRSGDDAAVSCERRTPGAVPRHGCALG